MAAVRNLMIRCGADFSAATKATNRFRANMGAMYKSMGLMKSAFRTLGLGISVAALISFGKNCVEAASDLQEVQNVVDVTFGSMNSQINAFSKNAITQFGLSETAAKRYAGTMGAMLKSMGLSTQASAAMSMEITGLAGDMASFYNLRAEDAFTKIRSGISGETEPLKQLGINMSIVNLEAFAMSQGIIKSYKSMTQAEQALLRYNYLMSVTKDAQGDFSRTSGSWANQTRILAERFNQLKTALGQGLIQALTPVLTVINQLMARLVTLANTFSAITAAIFGKQTAVVSENAEAVQQSATAQNNLAKGIGAAGKAAKKATAGFDELNILQDNKASGGGGGGGGTAGLDLDASSLPSVDPGQVEKIAGALQPLVNAFKEVLGLFQNLKLLLTGDMGIGTFLGSLTPLQTALVSVGTAFVGIKAAAGITSVLSSVSGTAGKLAVVLRNVTSGGMSLAASLQKVFGAGSVLSGIGAVIGGATLAVTNFFSMLKNGFSWIKEALMVAGIALAAVGAIILGAPALVAGVVAAVVAAVATAAVVIKENWDAIKQWFSNVWAAISGAASKCWSSIVAYFSPAIEWFGQLFSNVGRTLSDIFHNIGVVVSGCWELLKLGAAKAWSGIKSVFSPLAEFFGNIFAKAWSGIVKVFSIGGAIFKNIQDAITKVFKIVVNGIISGLNKVIAIPFNNINAALKLIRSISIAGISPFSGIKTISVPQIPKLATGAVIPPNREFMAILGDQRHGTNIETPERLLRSIYREEMGNLVSSNMAGHEATVAVLQDILEAVLGIDIGDDVIASAVNRYNTKMAISRGGIL